MEFGAAIFFTDYSMSPADLGRALDQVSGVLPVLDRLAGLMR